MNDALTATVALAGLFFSLSCALLLEELLFGVVFRLMACSKRIAAELQRKGVIENRSVATIAPPSDRKELMI